MTQMTLFSDLTTLTDVTPSLVVPVVTPAASGSKESRKNERDTLSRLAELIRDGRAAAVAQSQARSRPIQSIGELAQSVLLRHDLVARRRAARAQAADRTAAGRVAAQTSQTPVTATKTRVPVVGLAQTPAQVHVAS